MLPIGSPVEPTEQVRHLSPGALNCHGPHPRTVEGGIALIQPEPRSPGAKQLGEGSDLLLVRTGGLPEAGRTPRGSGEAQAVRAQLRVKQRLGRPRQERGGWPQSMDHVSRWRSMSLGSTRSRMAPWCTSRILSPDHRHIPDYRVSRWAIDQVGVADVRELRIAGPAQPGHSLSPRRFRGHARGRWSGSTSLDGANRGRTLAPAAHGGPWLSCGAPR